MIKKKATTMKTFVSAAVALSCGVIAFLISQKETDFTSFKYDPKIQYGVSPSCFDGHRYNYGRYVNPLSNITFHCDLNARSQLKHIFQIKKFHYTSINTEDYFIGFAIVQLNYVAETFFYIVDKKSTTFEKYEYQGRLPFGIGISFASSSVDDKACTKWSPPLSRQKLSVCYNSDSMEWEINAHLTLANENTYKKTNFTLQATFQKQEAMVLLFPVGKDGNRPAYVHKGAGYPAKGTIHFGSSISTFDNALAAIDWTRSVALRHTVWKWASASFHAQVVLRRKGKVKETSRKSIGINLSSDVYDYEGESQENAIWIDGVMFPLQGVKFSIPKNITNEKWQITSSTLSEKENIDLEFQPLGSREDHTHLYFVVNDFVQPYGKFSGNIHISISKHESYEIHLEDIFGVVEDHSAIW